MKKLLIYVIVIHVSFFCQQGLSQTTQTIVGWANWIGGTTVADQGVAGNIAVSVLGTEGGVAAAITSDPDGSGQRAFAVGWSGGANPKAWRFPLVTTKYATLKYSCRMSGTGSPSFF